ncbi:hypothetical protein U1Q18_049327 [Sarracenia purpurea var. burkii]
MILAAGPLTATSVSSHPEGASPRDEEVFSHPEGALKVDDPSHLATSFDYNAIGVFSAHQVSDVLSLAAGHAKGGNNKAPLHPSGCGHGLM